MHLEKVIDRKLSNREISKLVIEKSANVFMS